MKVFLRLREDIFKIKIDKPKLSRREDAYLEPAAEYKLKELKSFVGCLGYYQFVIDFRRLTKPSTLY